MTRFHNDEFDMFGDELYPGSICDDLLCFEDGPDDFLQGWPIGGFLFLLSAMGVGVVEVGHVF